MKRSMYVLVAVWVLYAAMGMAQGSGSRFFRIKAPESIRITGISDGVMTWDQPEGVAVTIEVSENLADSDGWRRYTEIPGDASRGSVRVFDQDTPSGMVLIPGGTNAGTDPDRGAYSLTVTSFYMDRYQVTKALWDEVYDWAVTQGGYSFDNDGSGSTSSHLSKGPNHPVHGVNWYDAVKWCNARSEKEGRPAAYTVNGVVYRTGREGDAQIGATGYRLPTVAEWEYAARGGLSGKRYPWGDTIDHSHANYRANSLAYSYDTSPYTSWTYHPAYNDGVKPYTSPVGSFAPNGYGLYDMIGNIHEWCFDWAPSRVGFNRVVRGSGWWGNAQDCRSIAGTYSPPDGSAGKGFRTVLPAQ